MRVERKIINSLERMYYFDKSFPVVGAFYGGVEHSLLEKILGLGVVEQSLLTRDFLYVKSKSTENADDVESLVLAEVDDYLAEDASVIVSKPLYITEKIKLILALIIAPFLQRDGGDIEFVFYENEKVKVRFLGKCQGCPYAQHTLTERVVKNLTYYIPQVKEVELVQ